MFALFFHFHEVSGYYSQIFLLFKNFCKNVSIKRNFENFAICAMKHIYDETCAVHNKQIYICLLLFHKYFWKIIYYKIWSVCVIIICIQSIQTLLVFYLRVKIHWEQIPSFFHTELESNMFLLSSLKGYCLFGNFWISFSQ